MKYRFQHFMDISTSAESMQIIQFRVGGADVIRRCAHLFNSYKYFKLGKISVKFVPASTLPVDPLGLSYADDDPNTVDPRDQLNPGLVRITNGEDIQTDISGYDDAHLQAIYEAMLLDPRWFKFGLQSGFKRSAVPLYWQVGQLAQDQYPGSHINFATANVSGTVNSTDSLDFLATLASGDSAVVTDALKNRIETNFSDSRGLFQVGHRGRIGWLPTDAYQRIYNEDGTAHDIPMLADVPSIQTITCVTPKAFKTLYYYRVYITEEVYFSGLKSIAPYATLSSGENNCASLDIFARPMGPVAQTPGSQGTYYYPVGTSYQPNDGTHRESGRN